MEPARQVVTDRLVLIILAKVSFASCNIAHKLVKDGADHVTHE